MRRLTARRVTITAVLATAGLLAAACGNSGPSTTSPTGPTSLTISDETGATWNCQFNPLSKAWPEGGPTETGWIYEPLLFVDAANTSQAPQPWLATGYKWNTAGTQLTFTIRKGVKFSNGTPMTPADVAFSFNILKNTSVDLWSLWKNVGGPLSNVAVQGDNVVLTFSTPAATDFYYVADQVPILPSAIWSKIKPSALASYADSNPVGTGAYKVGTCTANNISYTANTGYWQPGKPAIKTLNWPAYLSNTTANDALEAGTDQWGAQYIPEYKTQYLAKNAGYRAWFPALTSVTLIPNLSKAGPLQNVKVRQALSLAINRAEIGAIGETQSEGASNQDGIAPQFASHWTMPGVNSSTYFNDYAYNQAEAIKLLQQAGYNKVVGGVRQNNAGVKLSFQIKNNGSYSDWVEDVNVMVQELAKVGIQATAVNESGNAWSADITNGNFQLGIEDQTGGPAPYFEFRQWLLSANIGTTNFERLKDPHINALLDQYASTPPAANGGATTAQKAIINQIEQYMLTNVPYIPVLGAASWDEYNVSQYSGWPTKADPYALGQTAYPDEGWVMLHLKGK